MMVAWRLCSYKKVVTILLWYVIIVLVYSSVFLVSGAYVLNDWCQVVLSLSIIIFFLLLDYLPMPSLEDTD